MSPLVIKENNKIGYINKYGEIVIRPQFDSATLFHGGFAKVKIGDDRFVINESGDIQFKLEYETLGGYSNDRCEIVVDDKKGFIDSKGQIIVPPIYSDASTFQNGYAVVNDGRNGYFIDVDGKIIFESDWLFTISTYKDGLINKVTRIDNLFYSGFIDLSKNWIIPPTYIHVHQFHEGLAAVQFENEKFGFINKQNQVIIEPEWNGSLIWFTEGLCPVWNEKYGFIDKRGQLVINQKFYLARHFSSGLSLVRENQDSLYGYINKNGEWIIEPQFKFAESFINGIASVDNGFITPTGEYIYKSD